MPEKWTGDLVGRMHVEGVTYDELATEANVCKSYISMILNGKRKPIGSRERLESALDAVLAKRVEVGKTVDVIDRR